MTLGEAGPLSGFLPPFPPAVGTHGVGLPGFLWRLIWLSPFGVLMFFFMGTLVTFWGLATGRPLREVPLRHGLART